jgi:hypothetical protein
MRPEAEKFYIVLREMKKKSMILIVGFHFPISLALPISQYAMHFLSLLALLLRGCACLLGKPAPTGAEYFIAFPLDIHCHNDAQSASLHKTSSVRHNAWHRIGRIEHDLVLLDAT